MRKHQPFFGFIQEIIRNHVRFVAAGLEPRHGNTDILRRIAARARAQLVDDRFDRIAGIEDVVNDQNTVVVADLLDDVVESVHGNGAALIDADVRRRPDCDVIGLDAAVGEHLLDRHADWCAAAPYGDNHCRLKAALEDLYAKFNGVFEEVLSGKNGFVHYYSRGCGLAAVVIMRGLDSIAASPGNNNNAGI